MSGTNWNERRQMLAKSLAAYGFVVLETTGRKTASGYVRKWTIASHDNDVARDMDYFEEQRMLRVVRLFVPSVQVQQRARLEIVVQWKEIG